MSSEEKESKKLNKYRREAREWTAELETTTHPKQLPCRLKGWKLEAASA
jgi:hypothetical protein